MFRGNFERAIDQKGRLSVPAKFRDFILAADDDRVVVTNYHLNKRRCLHVYPYRFWVELEERVARLPQFQPATEAFQIYYLGGAHDCQLDKQGRILLPATLREYAGLDRVAVLVGATTKFVIWNLDTWRQMNAEAEALMSDPAVPASLGL